jgi:hypothetical protein
MSQDLVARALRDNTPRSRYSIIPKLANPYGTDPEGINKKLFSFMGWWQGYCQERLRPRPLPNLLY